MITWWKAARIGMLVWMLFLSTAAYVQAERGRPLEDLLPREALGFSLEAFDERAGPFPSPPSLCGRAPRTVARLPLAEQPYQCVASYWQDLLEIATREQIERHPMIPVEDYRQVIGGSDQVGIAVVVFDLQREDDATRATRVFADTLLWHFPRSYSGTGIVSWEICMLFRSSCGPAYEEFTRLRQEHRTLDGVRLIFNVWLRRTAIPAFDSALLYTYDHERFVGLFGTATFALSDLSFFVAFDAYLQLKFPDDWQLVVSGEEHGTFDKWRCYVGSDGNIRCEVETQKCSFVPWLTCEEPIIQVIETNVNVEEFYGAFSSLINTTLQAAMGRG